MSPSQALSQLMEGNARFASGKPCTHPSIETVTRLASGQHPFATILACADSRVPVETIFDRDPGEIFVVRLAGNFVSDAALGSIEYATAVLKSPLVLVLGHSTCGAVQAAVDFVRTGEKLPGHMQLLADAVAPAARKTQHSGGNWLHDAVYENVRLNVATLKSSHPVMSEALGGGEIHIAGGVYDLATAKVTLL